MIFDCDSLEKTYKKETQRIGIEKAKANNTYTGRLHGTKMSKEDVLKKYNNIVELLNKGISLRKCAKRCDCSLGTVQKVKRLIDTED